MIRHLMKMASTIKPKSIFGGAAVGSAIGGTYSAFTSDSTSTSGYIKDVAGGVFAGGVLGSGARVLGSGVADKLGNKATGLSRSLGSKVNSFSEKTKGAWKNRSQIISKMKESVMSAGDENFNIDHWKEFTDYWKGVPSRVASSKPGVVMAGAGRAIEAIGRNPGRVALTGTGLAVGASAISLYQGSPDKYTPSNLNIRYDQQSMEFANDIGLINPSPGTGVGASNYMNNDFASSTYGLVQGLHSRRH